MADRARTGGVRAEGVRAGRESPGPVSPGPERPGRESPGPESPGPESPGRISTWGLRAPRSARAAARCIRLRSAPLGWTRLSPALLG